MANKSCRVLLSFLISLSERLFPYQRRGVDDHVRGQYDKFTAQSFRFYSGSYEATQYCVDNVIVSLTVTTI